MEVQESAVVDRSVTQTHAQFLLNWLFQGPDDISRCCYSYLEQFLSAHRLGVLSTSLQSTSEDLPICTFLPMNVVQCLFSDYSPPPPPQLFYEPFSGTTQVSGARRELLDFMVQGEINRGRHTDHVAGRHSIRTNQCPTPPSPHIFYRPDALPAAQPTVSMH